MTRGMAYLAKKIVDIPMVLGDAFEELIEVLDEAPNLWKERQ